jgi:hypothetical protein
MTGTLVFKCQVTEAQANSVRERIDKAGLRVGYQEEQHGAALILIVTCGIAQGQPVREVLSGVGVIVTGDL